MATKKEASKGAGAGAAAAAAAAPAPAPAPPVAPAAVPGVELAPSLRGPFRDLFKLIEDREYRRAFRTADTILKAVPGHGETLALKGLAQLNSGRKEEAGESARAALKATTKSYIVWHIYGLVCSRENQMAEAIRAYYSALAFDAENAQILRDLSLAQLAVRDYRGHHDTRRRMVASKSGASNKAATASNWVGLAVAHQLAGNADLALAVLDQYETMLEPDAGVTYESSELQLYRVRILEQKGDLAGALSALTAAVAGGRIMDRLGATEKTGQLLFALGQVGAARDTFLSLLRINPEHYGYHRGLQACLLGAPSSALSLAGLDLPCGDGTSLTPAAVDALLSAYLALAAEAPRSRTIRRIPLTFLPADHPMFRPALAAYLRNALRKGIPSAWTDLKHLARSRADAGTSWHARVAARAVNHRAGPAPTAKAAVLAEVLAELVGAARTGAAMPVPPLDAAAVVARLGPAPGLAAPTAAAATAAGTASGDAAPSTPPDVLPWALLAQARLADECGDTGAALAALDAALAHTPTALDLYLARARVLKHAGRLHEAAEAAEYGRSLDLADRYLNNKAVKYLLRAGRVEQANRTMALFSHMDTKDVSGDPLGNIRTLQVLWFELEKAAAYERHGNLGLALKHYGRVDKHIHDMVEDHNDFHSYVLRKGPLRAYADLMATTDKMRSHAAFLRAMAGMVRCHLALAVDAGARAGTDRWATDAGASADAASLAAGAAGAGASVPALVLNHHLTQARTQVSDATAAAASIAAAAAKAAKAAEDADAAPTAAADGDQVGNKVAGGAKPLEEAARYLAILLTNMPAYKLPATAVAAELLAASLNRMTTPTAGGTVEAPTSSSDARLRAWNITPDFVAEVHALAADVYLARGKLLPAVAHATAAATAAAATKTAGVVAALAGGVAGAAGLAPGLLHPATLAAQVRVAAGVTAELAGGAGSALAPAHASLRAFLAGAGAGADRLLAVATAAAATCPDLAVAAVWATLTTGARTPLPRESAAPFLLAAPAAVTAAAPAPLPASLAAAAVASAGSPAGTALTAASVRDVVEVLTLAGRAGAIDADAVLAPLGDATRALLPPPVATLPPPPPPSAPAAAAAAAGAGGGAGGR